MHGRSVYVPSCMVGPCMCRRAWSVRVCAVVHGRSVYVPSCMVGPCMCRVFLFPYQTCNVKTKKEHKVLFFFFKFDVRKTKKEYNLSYTVFVI